MTLARCIRSGRSTNFSLTWEIGATLAEMRNNYMGKPIVGLVVITLEFGKSLSSGRQSMFDGGTFGIELDRVNGQVGYQLGPFEPRKFKGFGGVTERVSVPVYVSKGGDTRSIEILKGGKREDALSESYEMQHRLRFIKLR